MKIRDGRREQITRGRDCFWLHEFFKTFCQAVNCRECNSFLLRFVLPKKVSFMWVLMSPAFTHLWQRRIHLSVVTCWPQSKRPSALCCTMFLSALDLYCKIHRMSPAPKNLVITPKDIFKWTFVAPVEGWNEQVCLFFPASHTCKLHKKHWRLESGLLINRGHGWSIKPLWALLWA